MQMPSILGGELGWVMNTPDLFDICRNRHKGNEESHKANLRVNKKLQRERVLSAIRNAGPVGLTCRELAELWDVGMNTISGRFSELKRDGLIRKDSVRNGCAVVVVA